MEIHEDERPIMTDLQSDEPHDDNAAPSQPWLRRFANIVGFASAGVSSPGGSQMFS